MNKPPFDSHNILIKQLEIPNSNNQMQAYLIGFDIDNNGDEVYRWTPFIKMLCNAIPEFAYGFHQGTQTQNNNIVDKLIESANAIYKIDDFKKIQEIYEANPNITDDELDEQLSKTYSRRGEFGELILHVILRDRFNTIPLISKIYFKDSQGLAAHGFDCVHIDPDTKTLFLGESKLYQDPQKGITQLIKDLDEHFNTDFFASEFSILKKRLHDHQYLESRDYWIQLISQNTALKDKLRKIKIPLICTYTCELFSTATDLESQEFIDKYTESKRSI